MSRLQNREIYGLLPLVKFDRLSASNLALAIALVRDGPDSYRDARLWRVPNVLSKFESDTISSPTLL